MLYGARAPLGLWADVRERVWPDGSDGLRDGRCLRAAGGVRATDRPSPSERPHLRARRGARAGCHRRRGRAVRRGCRRRARVPEQPRPDRGGVRPGSVRRAWYAHVPNARHRPAPCVPRAPVRHSRRRPGQDPGLPHRAIGNHGDAAALPRGA